MLPSFTIIILLEWIVIVILFCGGLVVVRTYWKYRTAFVRCWKVATETVRNFASSDMVTLLCEQKCLSVRKYISWRNFLRNSTTPYRPFICKIYSQHHQSMTYWENRLTVWPTLTNNSVRGKWCCSALVGLCDLSHQWGTRQLFIFISTKRHVGMTFIKSRLNIGCCPWWQLRFLPGFLQYYFFLVRWCM